MTPSGPAGGEGAVREQARQIVEGCQVPAAPDEDAITLDERWREALIDRIAAALAPTTAPGEEVRLVYDATFGDDRLCECGHRYYRHFDTYDNMLAIGCKGCECQVWAAPGASPGRAGPLFKPLYGPGESDEGGTAPGASEGREP